MRAFVHTIATLFRDRKAATAVEYGLILSLVVLALIIGLVELGDASSGLWGSVNSRVASVM